MEADSFRVLTMLYFWVATTRHQKTEIEADDRLREA